MESEINLGLFFNFILEICKITYKLTLIKKLKRNILQYRLYIIKLYQNFENHYMNTN